MAALRAQNRGDSSSAVELWRAGVTFATHVARDGSLVSVLTARAILAAQLRTARHALQRAPLPAPDAVRLRASLSALPVGAFAWDTAIDREAHGVRRLVRQLRGSPDVRDTYRTLTGEDLPEGSGRIPAPAVRRGPSASARTRSRQERPSSNAPRPRAGDSADPWRAFSPRGGQTCSAGGTGTAVAVASRSRARSHHQCIVPCTRPTTLCVCETSAGWQILCRAKGP